MKDTSLWTSNLTMPFTSIAGPAATGSSRAIGITSDLMDVDQEAITQPPSFATDAMDIAKTTSKRTCINPGCNVPRDIRSVLCGEHIRIRDKQKARALAIEFRAGRPRGAGYRLCVETDCTQAAQLKGQLCEEHFIVANRCANPDCDEVRRKRSSLCSEHHRLRENQRAVSKRLRRKEAMLCTIPACQEAPVKMRTRCIKHTENDKRVWRERMRRKKVNGLSTSAHVCGSAREAAANALRYLSQADGVPDSSTARGMRISDILN
ncbi:hypothetical protein BJ170DRAFT_379438 [Xylariales sp. AK1849]|nr:hypothetical protein BJ170DRAFT_379438 [Xylariales sp. AK1849]